METIVFIYQNRAKDAVGVSLLGYRVSVFVVSLAYHTKERNHFPLCISHSKKDLLYLAFRFKILSPFSASLLDWNITLY